MTWSVDNTWSLLAWDTEDEDACWSNTSGVSAPLSLLVVADGDDDSAGLSSDGESERGVEISLAVLVPRVAATEGDGGGSGERVK